MQKDGIMLWIHINGINVLVTDHVISLTGVITSYIANAVELAVVI